MEGEQCIVRLWRIVSLYSLLAESFTYSCGSIEAAMRCNDGLYTSNSWSFVDAEPMIENMAMASRRQGSLIMADDTVKPQINTIERSPLTAHAASLVL